ncbi:MAG: bifunctional deaminase-reductase, C-terminal [Ilumatobacteraceae bacterium]|nr:bifunctional deaminase-reductase, C-terminal [Ilumatobacteraceae bacterium]
MTTLRAHNISMSIDGYAAGPAQDLDNPMGVGGMPLHEWVFGCRAGRTMIGLDVDPSMPATVDDDFIAAGTDNIGATIMGRNMFGPVRGPWLDSSWTGWWGDEPPFHHPVFVLTHHARPPLEMVGTTFHFVTDGIEAAYARATEAANGADVRLGGGASTIHQAMRAGLLDSLHVAIAPVLLGAGERLLTDVDGYECTEYISSPAVAHMRITRR